MPRFLFLFRGSSMVEHPAVNRRVVGSNPTRGAVRLVPSPFQERWDLSLLRDGTRSQPAKPSSRTALSERSESKGNKTKEKPMPAWFYILRLISGGLYTGSTTNLPKRTKEHFSGKGSRTTSLDPPVALVYSEELPKIEEARTREAQVKDWTRAKKEALIRGDVETLRKLAMRRKR